LCSWQYLGHITLAYPSCSFRAVWRDKIPADTPVLGIGLSVEPLATVQQQPTADARDEENALDSARGIAKNLMEYLASFAHNTGQYKELGNVMILPTNAVDQWFEKFQHKHKLQPFFWIKKDPRAQPKA